MAAERVDDSGVSSDLAFPAAEFGVVVQGAEIVELGPQGGGGFGVGDEVVAGFADVGVGACVGGEVTGAVAAGESGLEELRCDPVNLGGNSGTSGGSDGDELSDLADGFVVGGAERR